MEFELNTVVKPRKTWAELSESTKRAYSSTVSVYHSWCAMEEEDPRVYEARKVKKFLEWRKNSGSRKPVGQDASALAHYFREASGGEFNMMHDPEMKGFVKNL